MGIFREQNVERGRKREEVEEEEEEEEEEERYGTLWVTMETNCVWIEMVLYGSYLCFVWIFGLISRV